jgi:hypothetical protein
MKSKIVTINVIDAQNTMTHMAAYACTQVIGGSIAARMELAKRKSSDPRLWLESKSMPRAHWLQPMQGTRRSDRCTQRPATPAQVLLLVWV